MGTAALRRLVEALDDLNTLDLDAVADAELHELAVGLARCRCRLLAATTRTVGVWEQRGTWRSDGSRAPWARLARESNLSTGEARSVVRRARALRSMPAVQRSLADGDVSGGHVDLLATACNNPLRTAAFASDEAWLLEQCRTLRFADAKQLVHYWCERVDPDGCERAGRDLLDTTSLTATETFQGSIHLRGVLDPVGGAMFRETLRRIEHDLYEADQRDGTQRSVAARRAAALVEMAVRAASTPPGGQRPEPLVCILAGTDAMARLCELTTGVVLTPGLVAPYLGASDVQAFVFDDAQHVLGVSTQRCFTGWLRRAIQVRDRHCRHPAGCDTPAAECDVDHIVPVAHGGHTRQDNGRLLCPTHNRNQHLRGRAPP